MIDIGIPGIDGITLTKRVRAELPEDARGHRDDDRSSRNEVLAALAAGADAYCLKSSDPERIVDAVRIASDGGAYFDPTIAHLVLARFGAGARAPARVSPLTARETEILRLISDGRRQLGDRRSGCTSDSAR